MSTPIENMTAVSGANVTAKNESKETAIGEDCTVQNDPRHKRNVTTADTLMDLIRYSY